MQADVAQAPTCKLCDAICFSPETGKPHEETLVYQHVNGKWQLARELVLHAPMIFIHSRCIRELELPSV